MHKYRLIHDYKDNETYRESFFTLANLVFKVDFRPWYEQGCWNESFICYSYVEGKRVIANVSVNKMTLLINGVEKSALQIGTVMTHPYYRHQGLAESLMIRVLDLYRNTCDFIYLFANETVLDFYPKFGFERILEYKYILDTAFLPKEMNASKQNVRKLDTGRPADFTLMHRLSKDGVSAARIIEVRNNAHLSMFYFMVALPDCVYYVPEDETIVLFKEVGNELHVFDVISGKNQPLASILNSIISPLTKQIRFHFIPDLGNMPVQVEKIIDEDTLFVRPMVDFGTAYPLIPLTSHA